MPTLYDPITVGAFELTNRVAMAPLTRMRSDEDGVPKDMNVEYYAQRASVGLLVTEGTFPAVTSRGFWGQAGIETAEQAWERITAGAALLQGYTGFIYGGPWWIRDIHRGVAAQIHAHGLDSIADAVGSGLPWIDERA